MHLDGKGDAWLGMANVQFQIEYEIRMPAKMVTNIRDRAGNVDVTSLAAKLDINTEAGNVSLTKIADEVTAYSHAGNVRADQCAATLKLSSGAGNVRITKFSGDWADAKTGVGNVTAELSSPPKSDCTFQTGVGNVSLKLPTAAA